MDTEKKLPQNIAEQLLKQRILFSNFFVIRKTAPPQIREWVNKYSNRIIDRIFVCRKPISGVITKLANIITLGKFDKTLRGLNYEDLFHLYLFIKIGNKTFILEKNEVVVIRELTDKTFVKEAECMEVELGQGIFQAEEGILSGEELFQSGLPYKNPLRKGKKLSTSKPKRIMLRDFMKNGEKQQVDFWSYNANGNNCQVFVESLLIGNGLINKFDNIHKFIKQETEEIFLQSPKYIETIAKTGTDIAGLFHTLKYGK